MKISRRKMLVGGGQITMAAGASVIAGTAFAAEPAMTSHEFTQEEIKAIGAPLHARLRDAMEAAGIKGHVVAGYNEENDDFFARWADWTLRATMGQDGQVAARLSWRDHEERREEFIAWFVQRCLGSERTSHALNGDLTYIQWHPVA